MSFHRTILSLALCSVLAGCLPSPEQYFGELVERLRLLAGQKLVAVYAGGSYALGLRGGRSDLDAVAVID